MEEKTEEINAGYVASEPQPPGPQGSYYPAQQWGPSQQDRPQMEYPQTYPQSYRQSYPPDQGYPADYNPGEAREEQEVMEKRIRGRGHWHNAVEGLAAAVSFSLSMDPVMLFPVICFSSGGALFFVPYTFFTVFMSIPLMFLLLSLGQYTTASPLTCWNMAAILKGFGAAMVVTSGIASIIYSARVAIMLYSVGMVWRCNRYDSKRCDSTISQIPSGEFGTPYWELAVPLLIVWILVLLTLIGGAASMGKLMYVTALLPCILLFTLLVRSLLLQGNLGGINQLLNPPKSMDPDAKGILEYREVWERAAIYVFFSNSLSMGGYILIGSYNKFHTNCFRDVVLVNLVHYVFSILAAVMVAGFLGHVAAEDPSVLRQLNLVELDMHNIDNTGFVASYRLIARTIKFVPQYQVWTSLFFLMVFLLGFSTLVVYVETVLRSVLDLIAQVRDIGRGQYVIRVITCWVFFLLSLPYTCPGGLDLLAAVDVGNKVAFALPAFAALICIIYIYIFWKYMYDLGVMFGRSSCNIWPCLQFVIPIGWGCSLVLCTFTMIVWWLDYSTVLVGQYVVVIKLIMATILLAITATPVLNLIWILIKKRSALEMVRPNKWWGPALYKHRIQLSPRPHFVVDPYDTQTTMQPMTNL